MSVKLLFQSISIVHITKLKALKNKDRLLAYQKFWRHFQNLTFSVDSSIGVNKQAPL